MKKPAFLLSLLALSLALSGCAMTPPPSIWPDTTMQPYFYEPKPMDSPEAAIGTLKNMQASFVPFLLGEGKKITHLEVDAYGLRAAAEWTETSTQEHETKQRGGHFVGTTWVPYFGSSTQYTTSQEQKESTLIIPFDEVIDFAISNFASRPWEFKWSVVISLEGARTVLVRLPDQFSARKFADAVATLAVARGRTFDHMKRRLGIILADITPQQKAAVGLGEADGAVLIKAVFRESLAERAGFQDLDVLIRVDGRAYANRDAFSKAVSESASLALTVLRRGTQAQPKGKKPLSVVEEKELRITAPAAKGGAREEYGGIGMQWKLEEGVFTVIKVFDDAPARKAGILIGDRLLQIDDLSVKGMTLEEVHGLIRGKPGTRVTLTIMREGDQAPREFTISRALIRAQ